MDTKSPSSMLAARPPSSIGVPEAVPASGRSSGKSGTNARAGSSVCVFWLHGKCYAVDVAYVAEVVALPNFTPVPLAPTAVFGVFNLRGTVLAAVDLAVILNLTAESTEAQGRMGAVLVLRSPTIMAGAHIDRAEAIYSLDALTFKSRATQGDHPAVLGLLPIASKNLVATMLDGKVLIERLEALQFNRKATQAD